MTGKILVVDDHVDFAEMIAEHLRSLGYETTAVASGREAIQRIVQALPDLVITDLRMTELDGLDVLDAVRKLDADTPVIVVTAFGGVEGAIESVKRGAYHYLVKPLRLDELALHVGRALEQRALRHDHRALRARLATLREVEDEYIEWMIEQCGGNKTRAAERLGIDKATLHRRAKKKLGSDPI